MTRVIDPSGYLLLLNELDVAVLVIGRDSGIIRRANHRVCRDMGKAREELVDAHYRQIFRTDFITTFEQILSACEDGNRHSTLYYWSEKEVWEIISAHFVVYDSELCLLVSIADISEVEASKFGIEKVTYHDRLTRLPNGVKLEMDIGEASSLENAGLVYFKISRLGEINDLYGWDSGDALLLQIRDWLLASESRQGQIYRVNNGFVVFGKGVTVQDAKDRAKEILERFNKPWTLTAGGNGVLLFCAIKLGIVRGKLIKDSVRNLLSRTIGMFGQGASGYRVYDENQDREARRTLMLRDCLINSIYNDMSGFDVNYQPIVDASSQNWVSLEALCRWTAPDGTPVPPVQFIHIAEQLGLIDRVDAWVRKTAMEHCVSLGLHEKGFVLDVNFSPTQKIDGAYVECLLETLDGVGFPARKLNLEITESAKMRLDDRSVDRLKHLQELGVMLSLDDFGTGYSSFENLIKLPANVMKTERLFLDGIEKNTFRQYLLKVLANLAHFLDMRLITEGVETPEQMELLQGLGADYMQGYLFSKPITFQQLKENVWRFQQDSIRLV